MEIKTKYSLGDEVWYISSNMVHRARVIRVNCDIDSKIRIDYLVDSCETVMEENKLFSSKKELLESL